MRMVFSVFAIFCFAIWALAGCVSEEKSDNATMTENTPSPQPEPEPSAGPMAYEELLKSKGIERESLPHVKMNVKGKGDVMLELVPQLAPETTKHILALIGKGFYNGQRIHRVEPWVVQWGDPQSKEKNWQELPLGTQGSGRTDLPYEENDIKMESGILAMASTGEKVGGDSQMFILTNVDPAQAEFLQGKYAAFGKVTEGMDVVNKLAIGDVVTMSVVKK